MVALAGRQQFEVANVVCITIPFPVMDSFNFVVLGMRLFLEAYEFDNFQRRRTDTLKFSALFHTKSHTKISIALKNRDFQKDKKTMINIFNTIAYKYFSRAFNQKFVTFKCNYLFFYPNKLNCMKGTCVINANVSATWNPPRRRNSAWFRGIESIQWTSKQTL